MSPTRPSCPVDWPRYRTIGIDLLIVGILVLAVSATFAFSTVCPMPETCALQVDWPTISPAIGLIAAGAFLSYMARRRRTPEPP